MQRRRDDYRQAVVAGVVAWALLGGGVALGGQVPALADLGTLPSPTRFDPARVTSDSLPSLDPAFVARVLGTEFTPALHVRPVEPPSSVAAVLPGALAQPAAAGPAPSRLVPGTVVHAPTNDARQRAYEVPGTPFRASTDSRGAARGLEDPTDCSPTGGTLWYAFTPKRDTRLLASTEGSDHTAALAVYEQGGELLGCDVAHYAQVVFDAQGGRRYLIQVAAPLGGGTLVFSLGTLGSIRPASPGGPARSRSQEGPSASHDARRVAFRLATDPKHWPTLDAGEGVYVVDMVTGERRLASVGRDGQPRVAHRPRIAASGRVVAFTSDADDLVPGDTNRVPDVFVHDLATGATVRASVSSTGAQATAAPTSPTAVFRNSVVFGDLALSADGGQVAFRSTLHGLTPVPPAQCAQRDWFMGVPRHYVIPILPNPNPDGYTACYQVYVRDLGRQTTVRVSDAPDGTPANGASMSHAMSSDGRFVAFTSGADNLVADDRNRAFDVFVHDRDVDGDGVLDETGATRTELVSRAPDGTPGNSHSALSALQTVAISGDGRWVAFVSFASNLVAGDDNHAPDVFLRDRATATTWRVSRQPHLGHEAPQGDGYYLAPSLSYDGRILAFQSSRSKIGGQVEETRENVVLYDHATGTTQLLGASEPGAHARGRDPQALDVSSQPSVSADGRYVVFVLWRYDGTQDWGDPDGDTYGQGRQEVWVYERPTAADGSRPG